MVAFLPLIFASAARFIEAEPGTPANDISSGTSIVITGIFSILTLLITSWFKDRADTRREMEHARQFNILHKKLDHNTHVTEGAAKEAVVAAQEAKDVVVSVIAPTIADTNKTIHRVEGAVDGASREKAERGKG